MSGTMVRNSKEESQKITIQDVADALGISKTTVSRAISGKGRIGEATRAKVMAYIEENDYQPNPIAKSLANQKTYNIAWVMPGDSGITDLPFFQKCMTGVIKVAEAEDYDVIISVVYENSNESLRRIVHNKKIDGAVLGRTLKNDRNVAFLKEAGIPFICIGSTEEKKVIQVDNDHVKACSELTSILLLKGVRKIALVAGSEDHIVNNTRKRGYQKAVDDARKAGTDVISDIYMNADNEATVSRLVDNALREKVECLIATDDKVCSLILEKLHRDNIRIPEDIKLATFYNSEIIANNQPSITCLQYDPEELGQTATSVLISYIEGQEVSDKTLLGYEVLLKGSTQ